MDFINILREQLAARIDERSKAKEARDAALVAATTEKRDLNETEAAAFNAAKEQINQLDASIDELSARLADLEAAEQRDAEIAKRAAAQPATSTNSAPTPTANIRVKSEPRTYDGKSGLYLRDLAKVQRGDSQAAERLSRHAQEMAVELRDVGRSTDTELGYFVPPLYAISDYAELARSGRPFADAIGSSPLPGGVDAVNIPRITTGTLTAAQNGDHAAVTNRDVVTAETSASLVTVAGYIDVAVQALDQSPIDVNNMLMADLAADYAQRLDTYLWSGSGSSGQPLGVLNLGGTNGTTYTATTATVAGLYPKIGEAISEVHTTRYQPAQVIFMHPTRWHWISSRTDADGRPLSGFQSTMPENVAAYVENVVPENRAGLLQNLPVILDSNIPTNLGSGTNEDRIVVARITDARLWESAPRMEAVPVVDASTEELKVRLKYWRYVIFLPGRFPASWSIVSGTGLTTPSFGATTG